MKQLFFTFLFLSHVLTLRAQFAPPAGQAGSSALYKDSSAFKSWASTCTVERGLRDIAVPDSGYASAGEPVMACGAAGEGGVVSLGDGGVATLFFGGAIQNLSGPDFAVFENGFEDRFLELAFVEVSSDGSHFVRFLATSLTQDTAQTGSFGYTDAKKINNLAGKYRAQYGTPFDLEELKDEPNLDVLNIRFVRIVDVLGSINPLYARLDKEGRKINDPYPTNFASSGFDLDAVGVIHPLSTGIQSFNQETLLLYPNPVQNNLQSNQALEGPYRIVNALGSLCASGSWNTNQSLSIETLPKGLYTIAIQTEKGLYRSTFIKCE